tara:strand:- start:7489 stop:8532 length:1044 start_codon:yes stop_codon:yes gene_type:complete
MSIINLQQPPYISTFNEDSFNASTKDGTNTNPTIRFQFNYGSPSTNYKFCLDLSGVSCGTPGIILSNQTLSNTNSTPSLLFNNIEYWFNTIHISQPGHPLIDYKNSTNTATNDSSMCGLTIINNSTNKDYLVIYVPIISSQQSNNGGDIIESIISAVVSDPSSCIINNTSSSLGNMYSRSINLGELIPYSQYYYFGNSNNNQNGKNVTTIFYPSSQAIKINPTTMTNLKHIAWETTFLYPSRITSLTTRTRGVYLATNKPTSSLEQEDDIYISCQPTTQEGELLEDVSKTPDTGLPYSEQLNSLLSKSSDTVGIVMGSILGIILMIVIMKGGEKLLKVSTLKFLKLI